MRVNDVNGVNDVSWASAMEGGPVMTDAEHWHRLYLITKKQLQHERERNRYLSWIVRRLSDRRGVYGL